jgi:quercetin dioxygenase-like cupin family protein
MDILKAPSRREQSRLSAQPASQRPQGSAFSLASRHAPGKKQTMKRWHLPSLEQSSDKRTEREPGADAPRVPPVGHQKPRVLFSSPECRAVVVDLQSGHDLGDHHVRERAMVQVISGRVSIKTSQETIECDTGTLVTFDPGERHSLHGIHDARLLLLLDPGPATATTPRQSHPTTSTFPRTRPPHRSPLHPPTRFEGLPSPEIDSTRARARPSCLDQRVNDARFIDDQGRIVG